jgi:hypothetical protein
LDDRRVMGVDEQAILREAQQLAEQLSTTAGTRARVAGRWTRPRSTAPVGAAVQA